jgi:tetratricopeptide (TPR) repeat protein
MAMVKTSETSAKKRFLNILSAFLIKYRIALITILIALVVVVIGYFVWSERQEKLTENAAVLAEEVQDLYGRWQMEADTQAKEALESELLSAVTLILDKYPRQYGAVRARYLRAGFYFEKEQWQQALDDFLEIARERARGYLVPLSLFNAAVCQEELDRPQEALPLYREIADSHPESHLVPHALFSSGRLFEQAGDTAAALAAYSRLDEEFPLSNWTKAGRNRIIALEVNTQNSQ